MMSDLFLDAVGVRTEEGAMSNSLASALGRNKTYGDEFAYTRRVDFRRTWATLIRDESRIYCQPASDEQHCAVIRKISDVLSSRFGEHLCNRRLRYGTSQKALNLYLKYLWRLNLATMPPPPHCPVDSQVLYAGALMGLGQSVTARSSTWSGSTG